MVISENRLDAWMKAIVNDEIKQVRETPEGNRNNRLNLSAFRIGQLLHYGLDRNPLTQQLTNAALEAGLDSDEATGTIERGITAGEQSPRFLENDSVSQRYILANHITIVIPNDTKRIDSKIRFFSDAENAVAERGIYDTAVPLKLFSLEQRHALVHIRRAFVTGKPKVIDGFTCIVQTDIMGSSQLGRMTIYRALKFFEKCGLVEKMPNPPRFKNNNNSTYLKLALCVLTGDVAMHFFYQDILQESERNTV